MTYKWNYLTLTTDQKNKKNELTKEIQLDPVLTELLLKRGISSVEEARKFLYPKLDDLHDPFLLPDMEKAIRRIEQAIGNKERILIYGDYDVDGTTAVSLVYKFLRKITNNIDYYIPDRYDEGYGISVQGIDYAVETGVKLIISLDCGIKAIKKVAYAKEQGVDFIICDHHMPDENCRMPWRSWTPNGQTPSIHTTSFPAAESGSSWFTLFPYVTAWRFQISSRYSTWWR